MKQIDSTQPVLVALVGASAAALDRLAGALARRIGQDTGLRARVRPPAMVAIEPGTDVLVEVGLPSSGVPVPGSQAPDLVLLVLTPTAEVDWGPSVQDSPWHPDGHWRQTLLARDLPWAGVQGTGEAWVDQALDALTPLLRRRARIGSGLFTRLARRDAEHAAWRWACDSCDVPECEHALRLAAPMEQSAALR